MHDSLEKYCSRCSRRASSAFEAFFFHHRSTVPHWDSTGCDTARDAASCRAKGGVKKRFTTSFRHDPFSIPTYTAIRASNHTSPFSFSRFRPFPLSSPLHLLENSARAAFHSRKTRERRITEIHRGSKYRWYSIDLRLSFRSFPLRWILRGAEGFESCDFFVARWSATVRQPWIEFVSLRVIANFYLNWCMNFNRCVRLTFFIDSFAIDRRG